MLLFAHQYQQIILSLINLLLFYYPYYSQLPLDEAAVRSAQNAARNEMLPIPDDQLAWLQAITKTHSPCLKTDADLPMLAHFLDNRMVLNYRNGSDWYDVHPLLREVVDNYDPAARLV